MIVHIMGIVGVGLGGGCHLRVNIMPQDERRR